MERYCALLDAPRWQPYEAPSSASAMISEARSGGFRRTDEFYPRVLRLTAEGCSCPLTPGSEDPAPHMVGIWLGCLRWGRGLQTPADLPPSGGRSPRQLAVLDPVRLVGLRAKPALAIGFVVFVVALEPHHLAVPFECQYVGRDAVEEPAIVADHHRAAGERQ